MTFLDETRKTPKPGKHMPKQKSGAEILEEEIFGTIESYALKGAGDEYEPHKKKDTEILSDI